MPCVNENGEVTESARKILTAMEQPIPLAQVATTTSLPLYRIRSSMRELVEAGLAAELDGVWQVTGAGLTAIGKANPPG